MRYAPLPDKQIKKAEICTKWHLTQNLLRTFFKVVCVPCVHPSPPTAAGPVFQRPGSAPKGRHTRGDYSLRQVPATSLGDKSHCVNWPFLLQNLITGTNFSPCD